QIVFDDIASGQANYVRFRLSPDVFISVGARVKVPGEEMAGEDINLIAHHHPASEMMPYERLLGDAIRGDAALFAREDGVEAAWRVVDPILDMRTPVHLYEPNSWGPPEADGLLAEGEGWHSPAAQASSRR